ncbi:cytoglobin-1-like isoform X1 [Myripristis murdjan]|uniref:cytoglobin-1-like isoform X1 n=1 Tax=Myripristis murdjan TaxID=586833 RepID=UPI001176146A|nr:cytoglobin-1-like isoform X1 [Myripristis murdjan]
MLCSCGHSLLVDVVFLLTFCSCVCSVGVDVVFLLTLCSFGCSLPVDVLFLWMFCCCGRFVPVDVLFLCMFSSCGRCVPVDVLMVLDCCVSRLFETHPECRDVFLEFRDEEDLEKLKASRELRAHGLRIMSFVEKVVARIDHAERMDRLILDLGRKHFRYHAPPKYYAFMGAEFIRAIQPMLKGGWSPEVEDAWQTLFQYIFCLMKRGFLEEERNQRS